MALDQTWNCVLSGGPRDRRMMTSRPAHAIVMLIRDDATGQIERHIYVLERPPGPGNATALFVWDRIEIAPAVGAPVADPRAHFRHWQRFDRVERSRILTLRALLAFLEGKITQREAAGEEPHRARSEAAAIRWAIGRIGADSVVSRRATPLAPAVPGVPGRRSDDGDRDQRGG